ncbi:uncharacterized protein, partial [Haliotis asinina]|uniref:uncharacterized protein n=1 Tax=Haliotis asinina TaxID=109174 RepID=UPI003531E6F6
HLLSFLHRTDFELQEQAMSPQFYNGTSFVSTAVRRELTRWGIEASRCRDEESRWGIKVSNRGAESSRWCTEASRNIDFTRWRIESSGRGIASSNNDVESSRWDNDHPTSPSSQTESSPSPYTPVPTQGGQPFRHDSATQVVVKQVPSCGLTVKSSRTSKFSNYYFGQQIRAVSENLEEFNRSNIGHPRMNWNTDLKLVTEEGRKPYFSMGQTVLESQIYNQGNSGLAAAQVELVSCESDLYLLPSAPDTVTSTTRCTFDQTSDKVGSATDLTPNVTRSATDLRSVTTRSSLHLASDTDGSVTDLTTDTGRSTIDLTSDAGRSTIDLTLDTGRSITDLTSDTSVIDLTTDAGGSTTDLTLDAGRSITNLTSDKDGSALNLTSDTDVSVKLEGFCQHKRKSAENPQSNTPVKKRSLQCNRVSSRARTFINEDREHTSVCCKQSLQTPLIPRIDPPRAAKSKSSIGQTVSWASPTMSKVEGPVGGAAAACPGMINSRLFVKDTPTPENEDHNLVSSP